MRKEEREEEKEEDMMEITFVDVRDGEGAGEEREINGEREREREGERDFLSLLTHATPILKRKREGVEEYERHPKRKVFNLTPFGH